MTRVIHEPDCICHRHINRPRLYQVPREDDDMSSDEDNLTKVFNDHLKDKKVILADQPFTAAPAEGGCCVMLPVDNPLPGWPAVEAQAVEAGMTAKAEHHLTLVFFGRDLSAHKCELATEAVRTSIIGFRAMLLAAARQYAVEHGVIKTPEEMRPEDVPPPIVPIRFTGKIGEFRNPGGTAVYAAVDPGPDLGAMGTMRGLLLSGYRGKVRNDFGGWRPHVTLAEGPPGSRLKRDVLVPAGIWNARRLILKLGKDRVEFPL
jgi:hypothetical protein